MAINIVKYGNNTLIDLTPTSATASDVASGKVFFDKSGTQTTGTASTSAWQVSEGSQSDMESFYLECTFSADINNCNSWIIYSVKTKSSPTDGEIVALVCDEDIRVYAYRSGNAVEEINQIDCSSEFNPISGGGTAFFIELLDNNYKFTGGANSYKMIAVHGESSAFFNFHTATYQPASGQTSATFTVEDEPVLYFCGLDTSVQANQYHRVHTVVKYDTNLSGTNFYTSTLGYYTDFTETYNNGTLQIASSGANNGGYFHNPGTYTLLYITEADLGGGNYQTKTVTPDASGFTVTADEGYDALKRVVVNGDADLIAGNIKNGVDIFGVTGTYSAGGGAELDTKTLSNNDNTATSLSFTSMKGRPQAFFLRCTSQVSSSGSTSYYYVIDMRYNGTNTTGNCFRIGSTRRVDNITSGYTWTYSGTTLTISSSGSRTASPGSFYNGNYELVYVY